MNTMTFKELIEDAKSRIIQECIICGFHKNLVEVILENNKRKDVGKVIMCEQCYNQLKGGKTKMDDEEYDNEDEVVAEEEEAAEEEDNDEE